MSTAAPSTSDADKLARFLDSIGSFSTDLILWFNQEQRLYHYTTLEGLRGMVASHDLWLTHARYCNDDEELTHGLQLTQRVLKLQIEAAEGKQREYLEELLRLICGPELDPVYICCFCEEDDLLSQWRAYAGNATGVSLAIEPGEFSYITGPDCPNHFGLMRFWKVFYKQETQEQIICDAIKFFPKFEPEATALDWARWTAESIRFFLPTFKNSDFAEEKEWRLIYSPSAGSPAQPSFRVARGMLIPYYSLKDLSTKLGHPSRNLPIRSVRIGPCPHRGLNTASTRMFLDQSGYNASELKTSATPYRG
ncbi:MAG: DUF2971 domain-containing protein [Acidobacteriota bacterium]